MSYEKTIIKKIGNKKRRDLRLEYSRALCVKKVIKNLAQNDEVIGGTKLRTKWSIEPKVKQKSWE